MYESKVSFTFDPICPWTFIAKQRLDQALTQVRASPSANLVTYTLHFEPYQLNPDFPESADKQSYQLEHKHLGNAEAQKIFQAHMNEQAATVGKQFNYDGTMGNTFHAHRVIQYFQEEKGVETANKLVDAIYRRYHLEAKHPSSNETLIDSCVEAGISEEEAKRVVEDESEGAVDVKSRIREISLDVDAVPVVVVEGKRRDMTLTGLKAVADYVKAMDQVAKEST